LEKRCEDTGQPVVILLKGTPNFNHKIALSDSCFQTFWLPCLQL
jgi:hypothetical protein